MSGVGPLLVAGLWALRGIGATGYNPGMETDSFDSFVALSDPLLVVVTVRSGAEVGGCLVGFHAQASIDPPLYGVWLSRQNRTTRLARDAEHLALHHLDVEQLDIAEHFGSLTGDDQDKFASAAWTEGDHRLPFLTDCPNRLVLSRVSLIDFPAADHLCWLGRVERAYATRTRTSSLRLSDGQDLEAGHNA